MPDAPIDLSSKRPARPEMDIGTAYEWSWSGRILQWHMLPSWTPAFLIRWIEAAASTGQRNVVRG